MSFKIEEDCVASKSYLRKRESSHKVKEKPGPKIPRRDFRRIYNEFSSAKNTGRRRNVSGAEPNEDLDHVEEVGDGTYDGEDDFERNSDVDALIFPDQLQVKEEWIDE